MAGARIEQPQMTPRLACSLFWSCGAGLVIIRLTFNQIALGGENCLCCRKNLHPVIDTLLYNDKIFIIHIYLYIYFAGRVFTT